MKVKVIALCVECVDTFDTTVDVEGQGKDTGDELCVDVSGVLCFECARNAGFPVGKQGVEAYWTARRSQKK